MLLLWERGLLLLLLGQLGRLVWLNAALAAYMTRTPVSWLAEVLLVLGLVRAARSPERRLWLSLTLGWAAVVGGVLGGYLADESGGGGQAVPDFLLGSLALLSLTALSLRRHNEKL